MKLERVNKLGEMLVAEGLVSEADLLRALKHQHSDNKRLGELLYEHHCHLRDGIGISTPKIERMLDAAMEAGALGGKVNGSGGGGTMFAYAPGRQEEVKAAIDAAGGRGMKITPRQGVTLVEESADEEATS